MSKSKNQITDDSQFRAVQLTINNPKEKEFTHDKIKKSFANITPTLYYCMADEIGGEGHTYHTHIYALFNTPVGFKTLKNAFPPAHIERSFGSRTDNIDYIKKAGKWKDTEKELTKIDGTYEEWGTCPRGIAGTNVLLCQLYSLVNDGLDNYEIMETSADFIPLLDKANQIRLEILQHKYADVWRDLDVSYIWGNTGLGKSRHVMEGYGYRNVFRVTDYKNPFDTYQCEDVVIFEEFASSIRIQDMNNYLDGYPLKLPARYRDKQACFTKVFVISNLGIEKQYPNIYTDEPEVWNAFARRFTKMMHFTSENNWVEYNGYCDYKNNFTKAADTTPFDTNEPDDMPFD